MFDAQRRLEEPLKKMSVLSPIDTSGAAMALGALIQHNRPAVKKDNRK
jgi:hypothetical protein